MLYLFSGPRRDADGFGTFCKANGIICDYVDIEYDESMDLADQQVWDELEARLQQYDGYLMSPPCSTFTAARKADDGGPPPLRGTTGRERYGLSNLGADDIQKVKLGTLMALRAHAVATHAETFDKTWVLEQPHWKPGNTSMFMLDEFQELLAKPDVNVYTLAQCGYGADAEKLTDLMTNRSLEHLETKCKHPVKDWVIPWSGRRYRTAHAPLKGRQRAIPAEQWSTDMLRDREPSGPYVTREFAAYPAGLNKALADAITACVKQDAGKKTVNNDAVADDEVSLRENQVQMLLRLRGGEQQQGKRQDADGLTLRNIFSSVTPKMKLIGKQVANLIERELDASPTVEKTVFNNIGRPLEDIELPTDWLDELREKVASVLIRNRKSGMDDSCDVGTISGDSCQTCIRGHFLEYWATATEDAAAFTAKWLYQGAPAGLECPFELDGICQQVDEDAQDYEDDWFVTDVDAFKNYSGVEDNLDAAEAIATYRDKGYLLEFDTYREAAQHLGANPTLSKLGCIVKEKVNVETGKVSKKTRIILDCKQSQVSRVAQRTHKSALPRATDAVRSALYLLGDVRRGESLQFYIADIADAFWLVPLRPEERRYFAAQYGRKTYVFTRTAQGSRGAPLTFSVIMALASRLVQSVVSGPRSRTHLPEAFLQVYVDDPLAIMVGSESRLRRLACMISVVWALLGFPVAYHKAVLAPDVVWIGVRLVVSQKQVMVEVPEAKITEIKELVDSALEENVYSVKKLRTLIGKCMAIASVIQVWRPFVQELYSAMNAPGNAPQGCVWTKQVAHTLTWIRAFLSTEAPCIRRIYDIDQHQGRGSVLQITWDASPYGMGAFLKEDGVIKEFFAIPISADDEEMFDVKGGGCEGQQIWECLAGLIAMRVWAHRWKRRRVHLHLRGDNMAALVLFSMLKTHSRSLAIIAREFALDLGSAIYQPDVVQHLPGISNILADQLSRRFEPGKKFTLHPSLMNARAIVPPQRTKSWYRSLAVPPLPANTAGRKRGRGPAD